MNTAAQLFLLHMSLAASCPIDGVSVADWTKVATTTTVWYSPSSTAVQRATCQGIITSYVVPADPPKPMAFIDFLNLFTAAEQAAIVNATDTNVKVFVLQAVGQGTISFIDPRLKAGLDYLVAQSLLTAAREAQILAGQPHP